MNIYKQIEEELIKQKLENDVQFIKNEVGSVISIKCKCTAEPLQVNDISQLSWIFKRHCETKTHHFRCGWYITNLLKIKRVNSEYFRFNIHGENFGLYSISTLCILLQVFKPK